MELKEVKEYLLYQNILQNIFQRSILGLQEGGLLEKFYFDELNMPPRRPLPKFSNKPMSIDQLILSSALLGIGLFLSMIAFLGEVFWYKVGKCKYKIKEVNIKK